MGLSLTQAAPAAHRITAEDPSVARCGVAEEGGEPQCAAGCVGDAPQPAVRSGVCLVWAAPRFLDR